MLLNSALSKISDIEVVFVIGSLPPFRSKSYVNVLDTKDSRILSALVDHFEGRSEYKLCIGLRQEDVLTISERLMDRRAKVKIREDNIGRRCVEFCSSPSSYVLSDDTDVIAFGAPNVIRNYLGKTECSYINHRDLLNAMELTRAQFIDYCILSGYRDFKVPEIYPGRAHEIIKRFKTLEDFFSSSFYVTLFNSKTGTALLKAHNMNLDEYTQQVLNFKALREELDIHKDFY